MAQTDGSWGGFQLRLTTPEVESVASAVNTLLQLVQTSLDIGLTILRVVETFSVPTLNPVRAVATELVTLCQNALVDLRKVGVYAHLGDLRLLQRGGSFAPLRGGYAAYERRMVARLQDRRDLNRPDFTTSTTVLAVFVYTAVDVSFTDRLLNTQALQPLRRTLTAFGRLVGAPVSTGRNRALPVGVDLAALYPPAPNRAGSTTENSAAQLSLALSQMLGRDQVTVTWSSAPGDSAPEDPPPAAPGGWLVEVSCVPDGYGVGWLAPATASTGGPGGTGSETGAATYTAGIYYEGDTGQPLRIYGGISGVQLDESVDWTRNVDGTTPRPGATPAFFFRDPSIPARWPNPWAPSAGAPTDTYYNQRTFFVGGASLRAQALLGGTYSFTLSRGDLPLETPLDAEGRLQPNEARPPGTVWVRVVAVSDAVTEANWTQLKWALKPRRTAADEQVSVAAPFGPEVRGVPSQTVEITWPSPETDLYTLALQTALAVLTLSRSDWTPANALTRGETPPEMDPPFRPTGLEEAARTLGGYLVEGPQRHYAQRGTSPEAFARDLGARCVAVADQITAAQGNLPAAVLNANAAKYRELVEWKWSDSTTVASLAGAATLRRTILETLFAGRLGNTTPVARNVYSLPGYWALQGARTPTTVLASIDTHARAAHYTEELRECAPVLYVSPTQWAYVREVIPARIYALSREVLSLAAGSAVASSWTTWRPLAGTGTLSVSSRYFQILEGFLRAAAASTAAAEEALRAAIHFLEQRIQELQELLRRLEGVLEVPFDLSVPDMVALPLVVQGTEGVVAGLLGASNKPSDGPDAYAGGLVLVAGGLPSLLLDLLLLLLGGGEDA